MINALIISDTKDAELGNFFQECKEKTELILDPERFNKITIDGKVVFNILLPLKANNLKAKPYLFINYSHGSDDQLLQNGNEEYLSLNTNIDCLKNTFIYSFACKSGKILGKYLCDEAGSLCFIGYEQDIIIQEFFSAREAFIECATFGLTAFVNGATTKNVYTSIKENYTKHIDEFYLKDMPTASLFMINRDALCIYGDKDLTINNLDILSS